MKLAKAYTYLADVQEHKQVIPFRRYAGGIGRAGQAKQFNTTKGQSPVLPSFLPPYHLAPRVSCDRVETETNVFPSLPSLSSLSFRSLLLVRPSTRTMAREVGSIHPPTPQER